MGAREITTAAVAASLAILAIFMPVVFMQGIVGKFFYQFGVTMSRGDPALAAGGPDSGAHALLAVPLRGQGNRLTQAMNRGMERLARLYRRVLELCLDHRWLVVGTALVV